MVNRALVITGIAFIVAMAVFARVIITEETRAGIITAQALTNSPLGQFVADLSPEISGAAQSLSILGTLLSLELPVYVFGAFLIILGLAWRRRNKNPQPEINM